MRSRPMRPMITSFPDVPLMISERLEPTMVGDAPRQLRTRAEAAKDTRSEDTSSRAATKANRVPARGTVKPNVSPRR